MASNPSGPPLPPPPTGAEPAPAVDDGSQPAAPSEAPPPLETRAGVFAGGDNVNGADLVVTDLAWPHISGVRFWVARGATIVSHAMSEVFLRRVVDRKWTLSPDALEALRSSGTGPRWSFRAVGDSLRLAGGVVTVHSMRGTSTEGAVGVWIGPDRFFWAGDYVQGTLTSPYQRDVVATIRALRLTPNKVGAQHVPLSDWSALSADSSARRR